MTHETVLNVQSVNHFCLIWEFETIQADPFPGSGRQLEPPAQSLATLTRHGMLQPSIVFIPLNRLTKYRKFELNVRFLGVHVMTTVLDRIKDEGKMPSSGGAYLCV
jgi:hypothetical protein